MNITTEVDYKGYNKVEDNFKMTEYFLKDFEHFNRFYLSQMISSVKRVYLFNFKAKKKHKQSINSLIVNS